MLINLRNALMTGKRLPYDAEVEYLQSTNATGYIDTGFAPSDISDCVVDIGFSILTPRVDNNDCYVFGGGPTWGSAIQVESNSLQGFQCSFGMSISNGNITWGTRTEVRLDYNGWEINDNGTVRSGTFSGTRSFSSNTIYLFAGHRNDTNGRKSGNKIAVYYFKILRNGVPIQDMIPVRKGTVGYLYDRVSGKLFGNAGTGDFVVGQDVVPVEYIESHGTEYIDTGTLVEMTDKVDCTFELLAYGNVTLAGGRVDSSNYSLAIWAYTNTEQRIRFDLLSNNHGGIATSIAPTLGQEYKVSKIGERNFVDGVEVQSNPSVAYNPSRPCYLFAMNNGGTASFIGNCRVKDFSIGSKLKYRPVRVGTGSTWEGAMMDVLTRRVYRNAGTGAFAYGNDLKYPIPAS